MAVEAPASVEALATPSKSDVFASEPTDVYEGAAPTVSVAASEVSVAAPEVSGAAPEALVAVPEVSVAFVVVPEVSAVAPEVSVAFVVAPEVSVAFVVAPEVSVAAAEVSEAALSEAGGGGSWARAVETNAEAQRNAATRTAVHRSAFRMRQLDAENDDPTPHQRSPHDRLCSPLGSSEYRT